MPSKTKERIEENIKKTTALKTTKKKAATKKSTKNKTTAKKKAATTKVAEKKSSTSAKTTKKAAVSKSTVAKKATTTKKVAKKETSKVTKKAITTKKATAKTTTAKKATVKKATTKKASTKKAIKIEKPLAEVVEYYDLPYRYNETIVKVLYQTPNTLFVYWDIADSDRENYIKHYGENFFNITRPVLIIHNETMHYSFEIPIDDFANSWYLRINDSKCNYKVELGRRPNYYNAEVAKEIEEKIHTDYIYVTSSNQIESPNDRVLFNTNENNTIKFRNVKNNQEKSISLYEIIRNLPALDGKQDIPYISEDLLQYIYAGIYENKDISLFDRIRNTPSSGGNPSSGSWSSRFM